MFGRLLGVGRSTAPDPAQETPEVAADTPAETVTPTEPVKAVVVAPAATVPAAPAAASGGWFQRLKSGLGRTSSKLTTGITDLFSKKKLDAETIDDLEDLLIQSDLGIATASRITAAIGKGRFEKGIPPEEVRGILAREVERVLQPVAKPLSISSERKPHVVMMVGVNGTGKTTTIGKLAQKLRAEGKSVVLAAGDTFRAAAIDQLKVWGERTGCPVVAREVGGDAAGLAYDALKSAQASGADVLLLDTAGRLQNKQALMEELEKVIRVLKKLDSTAPHDVVLVLDATTGQNALQQVEVFRDRAGVTGLVMTKLDGTARGGILVAIAEKFALPVHAIGIGEGVDDLQPFAAGEFAQAIAGT
nr:signal recognition particle-docking protein FtsY [Hyphomicrobium methylovorum]